ncbi:MAG: ATP-binding protein [Acidimicrobiales bacterium]
MRRAGPWPRSLRARLVTIYTAAAVVLGAGGVVAFSGLLHRAVVASVDATLQSRATALASQLVSTGPPVLAPPAGGSPAASSPGGDSGAQDGPGSHLGVATLDSFSAAYRPDGRLAGIQPAGSGSGPLTPAEVAAARADQSAFTIRGGDQQLRVLAIPVARPDGTWVVAAGSDLGDVTAAADRAVQALEVAVPILILLAALGAWMLSSAALRPVERMRADAANLVDHDPASRITVPATADELASLARTFNRLLDRLTRSLARQRDLIADAGHELRTPLAVLRTELELADTPGRTRDELADSVAHARGELERLSKVADDLLFLARADSAGPLVQPAVTDAAAVAADAVRAHRARADSLDVSLEFAGLGRLSVVADPGALRRAIDNLVTNALAACAPGGTVTVSATATDPSSEIVVAVSDDGPGFPPDFLPDAFGRFTRPDPARSPAGGGAGLGLAIVAEIVNAHGGAATATNRPGGGATVTLTLPREPAGPAGLHRIPISTTPP